MKKVRVGVVGVGKLGAIHARLYKELPNVELAGVCDIDKAKAEVEAKKLSTTPYTDYRDLIGIIDAASVVVPTKNHYKVAKDLLNAKVHLLIEKPITITLKEANALIALANKNKLILQVGHIERFNAAVEAVKNMSKAPKFIECHRLGPFTPRVADISVVLDLMIHDIDIVLGLVNSKIKRIEAVGLKVISNMEDIANARITFQNGTVADITASRLTPEVMRKIRIFVEDAYISLDYASQSALIHRKSKNGIAIQSIDIKKDNPLKKELASFIECVRRKSRPRVSGIEAKEALEVALKVIEKIRR